MKAKLAVIFMLFAANTAFAQLDGGYVSPERKALEKSYYDAIKANQAANDAAIKSAADAEAEKDRIQAKYDEARKEFREDLKETKKAEKRGGTWVGRNIFGRKKVSTEKLQDQSYEVADDATRLGEVERYLNKAQRDVNAADAKRLETEAKLRDSDSKNSADAERIRKMKVTEEGISTSIRTLRTNDRLHQVHGDVRDLELKLTILERDYDNALVGHYLEDKVDRMLNSKALCDATLSCRDENGKVIKDGKATLDRKALEEIFSYDPRRDPKVGGREQTPSRPDGLGTGKSISK